MFGAEHLIILILCALATFRLAEMFVLDDGPFDVFVDMRGWAHKAPDEGRSFRRMLAGALTCVHCAGVWIALLFAFFFSDSVVNFFVLWLAIAGLQSILANKLGRTQ